MEILSDLIPATISLIEASPITFDASRANHGRVSLTADRTLSTPTNGTDGQRVTVEALASGAQRILTLDAGYLLTTGITGPITIPSGKRAFLGLVNVSGVGWFVLARAVQS